MPHISSFKIENYKALRKVELRDLQPLNVFLGPNGCGKSTIFDAFQFIADCLQTNVRKALDRRGRFGEVRSRGSSGPIQFEIKYRESDIGAGSSQRTPLITYHLAVDEERGTPIVVQESLRWRRQRRHGKPFKFLDLQRGIGDVITGEAPEEDDARERVELESSDALAISALGQLANNPRVASLRRFIEGWYLSYFVPDQARQVPESGPAEHLSRTGDNLANVVQFLSERHPGLFRSILERVASRIPGLESVMAEETIDGRVALRFKDGPWDDPFMARHVSDGTIKMFAYLVLLSDPQPPPLLGIEEPENGLHPKLLETLADEFRIHAKGGHDGGATQVFVSSHSPHFVNAVNPDELWIMERNAAGYAEAWRADDIERVRAFVQEGARLGSLWFENQFDGRGNPRAL